MSVTQAGRLIAIHSDDIGPDGLLLRSFTCSEAVSSLYSITADVMAEVNNAANVTAENLAGKPILLMLNLGDNIRCFQGIVRGLRVTGREERFHFFQLDIVPQLWRLTQITDCRIFQNLSVPQIVEQILSDFGYSDYEAVLTGQYTQWDYCVMYQESYWDFISRLLEQEGIFSFWRHEPSRHVWVYADNIDAVQPCPVRSTARYVPEAGTGLTTTEDVLFSWEAAEIVSPGSVSTRDFNFQLPTSTLDANEPTLIAIGDNRALERFEFPSGISQKFVEPEERLSAVPTEAQGNVKKRMEVFEAEHKISTGSSRCLTFLSGHSFELTRHFRNELDGKYTLLSVEHQARQSPAYDTNAEVAGAYTNTFSCIPHAVIFRPRQLTPKPKILGPQTAIVVGPSGEEIYTDKFGRVKVQFHWDRRGARNESSSCWTRVTTPWAGSGWGMVHLPRIGQEVVVHFIDGDPDRPLIIGAVYNPDQMPPYTLPGEMTKSGIKSHSTKGAGEQNYNEIRFEDKKGEEEIHVHAEKNLTTIVESDESRTVGNTRTTTIQKDDTYTNKEGNVYVTIEKETRKTTIKQHELLILEEGNMVILIQKGDSTTTVDKGSMSTDVTLGSHKTNVPAGTMQADAKDIKQSATMSVEINANTGIKLSCGASSIELNPAMITISAPLVKIN